MLDVWAQAVWNVSWKAAAGEADTGHRCRQTPHLRARKGSEQHPAALYGQDMAVDACAGAAVK